MRPVDIAFIVILIGTALLVYWVLWSSGITYPSVLIGTPQSYINGSKMVLNITVPTSNTSCYSLAVYLKKYITPDNMNANVFKVTVNGVPHYFFIYGFERWLNSNTLCDGVNNNKSIVITVYSNAEVLFKYRYFESAIYVVGFALEIIGVVIAFIQLELIIHKNK